MLDEFARAVRVMELIYEAARTGRPVPVPQG